MALSPPFTRDSFCLHQIVIAPFRQRLRWERQSADYVGETTATPPVDRAAIAPRGFRTDPPGPPLRAAPAQRRFRASRARVARSSSDRRRRQSSAARASEAARRAAPVRGSALRWSRRSRSSVVTASIRSPPAERASRAPLGDQARCRPARLLALAAPHGPRSRRRTIQLFLLLRAATPIPHRQCYCSLPSPCVT